MKEGDKAKKRLVAMTASLVKANNLNEGLEKALRDEQKSRTSKETAVEDLQAQIRMLKDKLKTEKGAASSSLAIETPVDERCRKCDAKADKINELNHSLGETRKQLEKTQRAAERASKNSSKVERR